MRTVSVSEHQIGPFEYCEAVDRIQRFALVLSNLGLQNRFVIRPLPRQVGTDRDVREGEERRGQPIYQVVLIDQRPDLPKPEGLTTLHIKLAEERGYAAPRVTQYEAFGQRMNINQWAKAAGVSWQTLKTRLNSGMTMEEAVTDIALRRAA